MFKGICGTRSKTSESLYQPCPANGNRTPAPAIVKTAASAITDGILDPFCIEASSQLCFDA
jgi:hypothetical protein